MSQKAVYLNEKVVAYTGNDATSEFIGLAVELVEDAGFPRYVIEDTDYYLTPEEFETFVGEGVITPSQPDEVDVFGNSEQFYEDSEFFKGPVSFDMDAPRHMEIFNFTEGVTEKLTGFFGRLRVSPGAMMQEASSTA